MLSAPRQWIASRRFVSAMPEPRIRLSAREREKCFDDNGGICCLCGLPIEHGQQMEVHHVIELRAGGLDVPENRKPAHAKCHRRHTAEVSAPTIAKVRRIRQKHIGAKRSREWPKRSFADTWRM